MATSPRAHQYASVMDFPFIHRVLNTPTYAWLWLVARVYLGYEWLESGRHKVVDSRWMDGGDALKGFWERQVAIPQQGRPPIVYDWYRDMLEFMLDHGWYTWFAPLISIGELLVGIALIAGALTGFAALTGAFMNMNFMLAGTASSNPVLLLLSVAVIAAWRVAGYWGADRFLLRLIGTPWNPGVVLRWLRRWPRPRMAQSP
ncbi:MAG TPA: DoxX family protein [Dehalococcoidia bacterium]|nr:DoxX family protein [Dehalococcoidia bacterium]